LQINPISQKKDYLAPQSDNKKVSYIAKKRVFMLNLSVLLESGARKHPNKTAFIFGATRLSFAQMNGAANQIAAGLQKLGVQKGDKVALSCPNLPFFPMAYYGILKAGAAVVPLSVLLKEDEVTYHLQNSDAKVYLCFEGTADLPMSKVGYAGFQKADECEHFVVMTANPAAPSPIEGVKTLGQIMVGNSPVFETVRTKETDTAVIVYTSGTTGKPKGAELSHSNLLLNADISVGLSDMTQNDTLLIVLPLFHIFAMTVLMNAGLKTGATAVLIPRFDGDAVTSAMIKEKVTIFAGVPTMFWGLLHYNKEGFNPEQIKENLRLCLSGGASLPLEVLHGFEAKYEVPILEGYGMSEGSPVVTFNQKEVGCKAGSIGTPVWGVEVKLVDDKGQTAAAGEKGELLYRGHNVMKGYYKNPKATAETIQNGWLHSGDVAIMDNDGFYYIVDRTKDMIIRGGLNVYPRELEELIIQHPAVSLVAVIGVPNAQFGEEIKACVVLKAGAAVTEVELIAWTKERIASYKYPRTIQFMSALPMTATGKILKKELRLM
jgi:long-chain acyl-CoA synthetase